MKLAFCSYPGCFDVPGHDGVHKDVHRDLATGERRPMPDSSQHYPWQPNAEEQAIIDARTAGMAKAVADADANADANEEAKAALAAFGVGGVVGGPVPPWTEGIGERSRFAETVGECRVPFQEALPMALGESIAKLHATWNNERKHLCARINRQRQALRNLERQLATAKNATRAAELERKEAGVLLESGGVIGSDDSWRERAIARADEIERLHNLLRFAMETIGDKAKVQS